MTTTINTEGYRNSLIDAQLTFTAGQTESEGFSCVNLLNTETKVSGALCSRIIVFNAGFTTCDVTFKIFDDETYTNGSDLYIADGANKALYTLPSCSAGQAVSLIPFMFDAITYFKVVCSAPQVSASTATIKCQPLYQVEQ